MSQRIQARNVKKEALDYLPVDFGILLLASLLIYFERTAMLYVLATLGVTALLLSSASPISARTIAQTRCTGGG